MSTVETGQVCLLTVPVTDSLGAPVTAGVSGTMALYYLGRGGSATVPLTSGTISHQGNGAWGRLFDSSNFTQPGLYRYNVAALNTGSSTWTDQGGLFTVGEVPPEFRTLRFILTSIYTALNDGIAGSGTGGVNTLTDTARISSGTDDNEWVDSQLLILGPTVPATNPLRVNTFNHTTGVFTVTPSTTLTGTLDYLLINRNGAMYEYARVRDAIDTAIGMVRLRERVTDEATLTSNASVSPTYALPSGWRSVESVEVGDSRDYWTMVAPGYVTWDQPRRLLYDRFGQFYGNQRLRLTGIIDVPPPTTLGAIVPLPWTWVRDTAIAELLLNSDDAAEQRRAAVLLDRSRRTMPRRVGG